MRKILVVDDELSIVNFIADVSRVLGYEPKSLTSGKRVLDVAKEWKPDLITLDIMMPAPNGIEVLDQLKSDPETAAIPIYIISAMTIKPEMQGQIAKAQAVFPKPIDTKEFVRSLRQLEKIPAR